MIDSNFNCAKFTFLITVLKRFLVIHETRKFHFLLQSEFSEQIFLGIMSQDHFPSANTYLFLLHQHN